MPVFVTNNNPIAPATAPSADELLNAYQQHAAMLRGEADTQAPDDSFNPYAQQQQGQSIEDQQKEHLAKMEMYHAPIATKSYDRDSNYTDEKHNKFLANIDNHPLSPKLEQMMHEHLDVLRGGVERGAISHDDALEMFSNWGANVIQPMIQDHYKENPHKPGATLHDDQPEEVPDIVKKVRGKK
jgi:Na+-transporting NADH:ubiquinone oxidoreductase subunit NqrA